MSNRSHEKLLKPGTSQKLKIFFVQLVLLPILTTTSSNISLSLRTCYNSTPRKVSDCAFFHFTNLIYQFVNLSIIYQFLTETVVKYLKRFAHNYTIAIYYTVIITYWRKKIRDVCKNKGYIGKAKARFCNGFHLHKIHIKI